MGDIKTLPPMLFNSQMLWNHMFWQTAEIILPLALLPGTAVGVGFYSPSGELVGSINTAPDGAGFLKFELTVKKYGGLEKFKFEILRNDRIKFYNLIECRFSINNSWWYTGELIYKPSLDDDEEALTYEGKGFSRYLDEVKVDVTYTSTKVKDILINLINVQLAPNSPILYNSSLIDNIPDITISSIEFKKKSIRKCIEELLKFCNYDFVNEQFYYGINKFKEFYFLPLPDDIQKGLFEGYQYQYPKVKENIKNIVNKLNVYRTKVGGSVETEPVVTITDADSQAKWGLNESNLIIPVYTDNTTAQQIGQGVLEEFKNPKTSIQLQDLRTNNEPYSEGFYKISNRIRTYSKEISDFEILTDWDLTNITNTTVVTSTTKVFTGRKAFFITTTTGSTGEYIEKILDEPLYMVNEVKLMKSQNNQNTAMRLTVTDTDSSSVFVDITSTIIQDYYEISLDVTSLKNVKEIKIEFLNDTATEIYIDNLYVTTKGYFTRILTLEKITYKLSRSNLLATSEFGEEIDNLVEDIADIIDKQKNTNDVLEK